jgi:predicted O-methyltransferase YrrM
MKEEGGSSVDRDLFTTVDRYVEGLFIGKDAVLEAAVAESQSAGLPAIQVSPVQGRLLHLLAVLTSARRILEIGTLGGYSTIWLARALPDDGRLISLESQARHAEVARANIARAGLASRVEIRIGRALDTLAALVATGTEPFDMVFIDADKDAYLEYLQSALRLTRSGSLIIADNVVRRGVIPVAGEDAARARGVQRFNAALAAEPRVTATILPLAGSKGFDGMALAVVR